MLDTLEPCPTASCAPGGNRHATGSPSGLCPAPPHSTSPPNTSQCPGSLSPAQTPRHLRGTQHPVGDPQPMGAQMSRCPSSSSPACSALPKDASGAASVPRSADSGLHPRLGSPSPHFTPKLTPDINYLNPFSSDSAFRDALKYRETESILAN